MNTEFVRRELIARKYRLSTSVSQQQLEQMGIDVAADWLMGQLAVSLEMELYGEKSGTGEFEESMDFPRTWWQHLKKDFAPHWFLARWPVKTNTWKLQVKADRWRVYPNIEKPLPVSGWGKSVQIVDPVFIESVWE